MGKEAGYVYFEADCTSNGLNPFVPLDSDNPTFAAFQQKPLKVKIAKPINKASFNVFCDCFLFS
jgi:hypothetical protein